MTEGKATDEMLMAYVDGELDPDAAAEIARLAARDAGVAARIAALRGAREAVEAAFGPIHGEPVPERLVAAALGAAQSQDNRPGWHRRLPAALPLAAALVLVTGIAGFLAGGLWTAPPDTPADPLALAASPLVLEALAGTPSGTPVEAGAVIAVALGSHEVEGGVCRIFRVTDADGAGARAVACNTGGDWRVAVAAREAGDETFATASAAGVEAVDAFLDGLGAGPGLDAEAEAALIASGWR